MNKQEIWMATVRKLVTLVTGALITHGLVDSKSMDQTTIELFTAAIMLAVSYYLTNRNHKKLKRRDSVDPEKEGAKM